MRGFLMEARLLLVAQWLTALAFPLMLLGPAPMEVATALVALMFLARSAIVRDWSWMRVTWVRVLFALWIWSMVAGLLATDPEKGLVRALVWIRYVLLAPALVFWVLPDAKAQRRVFISVLGTMLFLCADSVLQYITGTDIMGREASRSGDHIRLTGPFSNPRVGITLVWIAFPILGALLAAYGTKQRLGAMALTGAVVIVAFLSGERMGFLLCALGMGLTFLFVARARLPLFIMGLVAVLGLFALMQARPALKERQIGQSSAEIAGFWESSYGRLWLSSLKIARHNPIAGVGPKHFRTSCPDPRYGSMDPEILRLRCTLHPHNIYMEWLAETGLVGFALFLMLAFHWLRLVWQQRRDVLTDALLAGLLVALLIRLWPLSATTSQFVGWSAGPFWILTGWLLARLSLLRKDA